MTEQDGATLHIAEASLRIGGMHCVACAVTIEQALLRLPGVLSAAVSSAAECATVRWDDRLMTNADLIQAVEAAGYSAAPDTTAAARALRQKEFRTALWRLFVAAFCAMQVMMLATPAYVSTAGDLAPDHKQLLDWGSWLLTLPVLCFSAAPFFTGAWAALRQRRIGMDLPVAIGIAVAFVASSGAAFDPGGVFGREVYFDSLTMFVSFLLGGRFLEMRARHRAAQALEASLGQLPSTALRVCEDGRVETVTLDQLQVGDRLRTPVGSAFAADGPLVDGQTQVDESLLSGEARPVNKRPGDVVVAGSLNLGAPALMRVERLGADTRYEQIIALMRQAQTQRSSALRTGERWAGPFLWTVLLLAAGAAAVWSVIDPSRAVWVAVSVLVVTCPCALSLAGPSALLAAAGKMARQGVLLRRLEAIEGLARMQVLFVDKTGTLTHGGHHLVQMRRLAADRSFSDQTLQARAATLAAWSSHPAAQALGAVMPAPVALPTWHHVEEQPGLGLQATDEDGVRWRLGSAAWCGAVGTDGDDDAARVWLARDGAPLARFAFGESLRDDAVDTVRRLRSEGVEVVLVSGDEPARVAELARQAGIAQAHGHQRPEDKLRLLAQAQGQGRVVAMLGDGINDAPVLARADVSLAMGEGAWVARSQADGVLVANGLADVLRARSVAKQALRIVRQNLLWAAAYNAACVPLALLGWLPPWAAGLGMATSSLLVVLNSMRLSR
ncbi:MAG: cadmium-translocating P-type ATPase [Burkholderiales bacterium]|nr:cadmium-translocating P-type ATPase [Burkholderiales bacterium]